MGCSAAFAVRPLAYHMGEEEHGGNRRERGPRTGVSRVAEAYRPPTVRCRPHRTHGRARDHQGRPILSPGSGGENGKAATDRKDRSGRRSWTFDREPDHGNALMIRLIQNPVRGYGSLTM